jgi:hypothetical protein
MVREMMRSFRLLSMIAAGAASAAVWLASPAAMAGNDVVKCVDPQGHVTLTDQPCAAGSASVRVATGAEPGYANAPGGAYGASAGGDTGSSGGDEAERPVADRLAAQRHIVPAADLRHSAWRPPQAPGPLHVAPLARDVATLKAARRAMMLLDGPRPSLAGLP